MGFERAAHFWFSALSEGLFFLYFLSCHPDEGEISAATAFEGVDCV